MDHPVIYQTLNVKLFIVLIISININSHVIYYNQKDIAQLPSRFRANMINSLTGYKSCNLIATKGIDGTSNLAVFSSVMHLGSSPALLGFILRPLTVRRDTYRHLKEHPFFTVNSVTTELFKKAHQTSAKYDKGDSEFNKVGVTEEYMGHFPTPYVKESPVKIGCRYVNEYEIKENDCRLVVAAIEEVYFEAEMIETDGFLRLERADTVAAMGMDGYALPAFLDRLAYAQPDDPTRSL